MPIKPVEQLVREATAQITTLNVAQVRERQALGQAVQLVDLRDVRELEREGAVPGAVHAPRGMIEFWVDPASPYYKPVFGHPDTTYVLFCAAGWRSALTAKTLQDMGMPNVAHVGGGFGAWRDAGAPVQAYVAKAKPQA